MKEAKHSGFETMVIGDLTIVSDLKERQGVTFAIHDFGMDMEYTFTRSQATLLHNFLGKHLLDLEVVDE